MAPWVLMRSDGRSIEIAYLRVTGWLVRRDDGDRGGKYGQRWQASMDRIDLRKVGVCVQ